MTSNKRSAAVAGKMHVAWVALFLYDTTASIISIV